MCIRMVQSRRCHLSWRPTARHCRVSNHLYLWPNSALVFMTFVSCQELLKITLIPTSLKWEFWFYGVNVFNIRTIAVFRYFNFVVVQQDQYIVPRHIIQLFRELARLICASKHLPSKFCGAAHSHPGLSRRRGDVQTIRQVWRHASDAT